MTRLSLISNGILLTKETGILLKRAGIDQLSVSLDFIDERHDRNRGHRGLFQHISNVLPELKEIGLNVSLNTVIMKDNMDIVCDIAKWAKQFDVLVGYSCYSDLKTKDDNYMVDKEQLDILIKNINNLINIKRELGNVSNSVYYLKHIPLFYKYRKIDGCQAGIKWVQVTPEGKIKRCSEMPVHCEWPEYDNRTFQKTSCNKCWFACRGESQAPLQPGRLIKYGKHIFSNISNSI